MARAIWVIGCVASILLIGADILSATRSGGLAEIGGFGAGSELQWELIGRAGYRISDTVSAAIGYRHLVLDFDRDRLDIDVTMTGPFLANDFTW